MDAQTIDREQQTDAEREEAWVRHTLASLDALCPPPPF